MRAIIKKLPLLFLLLAIPIFTPSQVPPPYEIPVERDRLQLTELYFRNQQMSPQPRQLARAHAHLKNKPAVKQLIMKNAKHGRGRSQSLDSHRDAP